MRLRGHNGHPGATLHHDTPMPVTPRRQRHESAKRSDGRGAITRAAGGHFDLNVTYDGGLIDEIDGKAGELLAAHYPRPWQNGHRYLPNGRKVPVRLRRRTYGQWPGRSGLALRRKNGEHTLTLNEALALCAEVGANPIKETKSRAFARALRPWQLLKRDCVRHDVPLWSKALVTMWGFKGKVMLAARVGVPLAAIYGKGLRGRVRRVARTRRVERGWKDGTRVFRTW